MAQCVPNAGPLIDYICVWVRLSHRSVLPQFWHHNSCLHNHIFHLSILLFFMHSIGFSPHTTGCSRPLPLWLLLVHINHPFHFEKASFGCVIAVSTDARAASRYKILRSPLLVSSWSSSSLCQSSYRIPPQSPTCYSSPLKSWLSLQGSFQNISVSIVMAQM